MEDVIFENFCRKGTKDYTKATKEQKTVSLMSFVHIIMM